MESLLEKLIYTGTADWSQLEMVSGAFEQLVQVLVANCGVLILAGKDGDGFAEVASVGYGEEGYYYSFMARGKGLFEKIMTDSRPLVLLADKYDAFHEQTEFIIIARIFYAERMLGFLLVEFGGKFQDLYKLFLAAIAEKIAIVYYHILYGTPHQLKMNSGKNSHKIMEKLIDDYPGLQQGIELRLAKNVLMIRGGRGSGKKSLARYIHKRLQLSGDLIIINTIPEQLIKLEKAISDWMEMVGNGMIIIERVEEFTIAQQKFFADLFESLSQCRLCFLSSDRQKVSVYPPFWKQLEASAISLPGLNSLEKPLLAEIIHEMVRDIAEKNNRPDFRIEADALQALCERYYQENLTELRRGLEHSIMKANQRVLKKQDLKSDVQGGAGLADLDDLDLRKSVESLERQKIMLANKLFAGNQVRMAKALGISRGSLQYKMKQMEL